jgi:hypothetical protein
MALAFDYVTRAAKVHQVAAGEQKRWHDRVDGDLAKLTAKCVPCCVFHAAPRCASCGSSGTVKAAKYEHRKLEYVRCRKQSGGWPSAATLQHRLLNIGWLLRLCHPRLNSPSARISAFERNIDAPFLRAG